MSYEDLGHIVCLQSDDSAKTDLELTCEDCGEHICDVEHDDVLALLADVAQTHAAGCKGLGRSK